ncbi:MAG: hypothetical protein ACLQM8_07690 [Limisphaerales bacterium]
MKRPVSNHAVSKLEDEFSAARVKAQISVKAARAAKEKARAAKRRLKGVRQDFKKAKKAAKKLAKLARCAEEELKTCAEKAAKEKKRTLKLARRAAARKRVPGAVAATTSAAKGKPPAAPKPAASKPRSQPPETVAAQSPPKPADRAKPLTGLNLKRGRLAASGRESGIHVPRDFEPTPGGVPAANPPKSETSASPEGSP